METYFERNASVLLKERNLTQKDFCEKLGKSKSNWDNIVKTNNLEMLDKIAQILGMKLDDVIGLHRQKFRICGFVKVDDTIFEIRDKKDVENVLKTINELNY